MLLCIAVLPLVGCTAPPPPDFVTEVWPVWTNEVDLVGDLAVHDEVVVAYFQDGAELKIGGWEAVSGDLLWSFVADVGTYTRGIVLQPSIVEGDGFDAAVYLAPGRTDWNTGWNRIKAIDIRTGRAFDFEAEPGKRSSDSPVSALSAPSRCDDEPSAACFHGRMGDNAVPGPLRLDLETATLELEARSGIPADARDLGAGIYSTNDRPPTGVERLGYIAEGEAQWEFDYEEVFGRGFSSDGGWSWTKIGAEDDAILIGWGGPAQDEKVLAATKQIDLDDGRLLALEADSGELLWSIEGAGDASCRAGQISAALVEDVFPVCVLKSGAAMFGDDHLLERIEVEMGVRGVDVRTGAVVWERWLGSDPSNYNSTVELNAPTGAGEWRSVHDQRGWHSLNVVTGAMTDLDEASIVMCSRQDDPFVPDWAVERDIRDSGYNSGEIRFPCTLDLLPTESAAASVGALRQGAAELDGEVFVVKSAAGLVAYRLE
ncbi:hypothetical protein ATC03_03090 [Agromyces aureus]|uniref:Pyrrolo-quinoline quinone n=1 Tax=Agromyces aureus TaxID=453304 RepID=A0A191WCF9_9MICO|nr:hypothetical protein ATC03_03090 [Agromyces aureus]